VTSPDESDSVLGHPAVARTQLKIDTTLRSDTGPIRSSFASDGDFAELLQQFVETIPEKRQTVRALQQKGAVEELRVWAHQLRGASGGYGFAALSEAAAELEQSCKTAQTERVTRAVDRIIDYMNRIEI
jgi:HPt (histidine-containing phosphotransfer) domain-containing protein